jgi:hypothetical protein
LLRPFAFFCRTTVRRKLSIDVGCGYDITIRELALLVAKVVGIDAELVCRYVKTGVGYEVETAAKPPTEEVWRRELRYSKVNESSVITVSSAR